MCCAPPTVIFHKETQLLSHRYICQVIQPKCQGSLYHSPDLPQSLQACFILSAGGNRIPDMEPAASKPKKGNKMLCCLLHCGRHKMVSCPLSFRWAVPLQPVSHHQTEVAGPESSEDLSPTFCSVLPGPPTHRLLLIHPGWSERSQ